MLEGGGDHHHHHHHDHDHDHDHSHQDANHGNATDHHSTHTQHQKDNQIENEIIVSKPAKKKLKSPDRSRKGRKFSNTGKRKEKNFNRPFPFRIPRTSFSCKDRAPGYYADMEADCQVR